MFKPKLFTLLKGYTPATLLADSIAGVTVGVVALPLAMAFAIASGLPPERGIFTAIVAGFLLGYLALRSRSFLWGVALHWSVAITMDTMVLGRELGFGEALSRIL